MVGFQTRHDTWFRYWMIHSFSWWGRFIKISPVLCGGLEFMDNFWLVRIVMSKWVKDWSFSLLNGPSKGMQLGWGSFRIFLSGFWLKTSCQTTRKKKGQKRRCGGLAICDVLLFFLMFWAAKCDGFGSGKVLKRHGFFRRFFGWRRMVIFAWRYGLEWYGNIVCFQITPKYRLTLSIHHQTITN